MKKVLMSEGQESLEQQFREMVDDAEEVLKEKPIFNEEIAPKRDMTWFFLVGLFVVICSGLVKISARDPGEKTKAVQLINQNDVVHGIPK